MEYFSFKICEGLYCIGDVGASSYIVDTGEGLLMFDTGYLDGIPRLLLSMEKLGISHSDIRWIVHTHGHIDHFGGTRQMVSLTNARTYLGAPDRAVATGEKELSFARELGMEFTEYFEPDVLIYDGDVIAFGDIKVRCVATPGHTEGTFSYFFMLGDKRVGIHGGAGLNTLVGEYLDKMGLPYSLREDYIASMDKLKREGVDIFLGNHLSQNDTAGKYKRLKAGESDAFVDPCGWSSFLEKCKENLLQLIQKEQDQKDG